MSRDDGFTIADVDSSYFEDAKWREAWQTLRDPDQMAKAVCIHASTLLASWRQGERLTVRQSAPLWLLVDDALVALLQACGLLDDNARIPVASWDQWFGAAFTRREARRESGRIGGKAPGKHRPSEPQATLDDRSTDAEPVRPSVPSVPTDRPSDDARANSVPDDGRDDLEAWLVVKHRTPSPRQRDVLDNYCRVFDQTGPARAAGLIYRNPDDPIKALLADLDGFRKERAAAAPAETKPKPRRGPSVTVFTSAHNLGYHEANPDERCPMCREGSA
jgi:hypothetical protein